MIDLSIVKEFCTKAKVVLKDNLVLLNAKPHTAPVAHLDECSNGVLTANYYFSSRYFNLLDENQAKSIVSELKKLQNTDKTSEHYGCMRWYREETFISDTNGAFFILLPLALTYKFCNKILTPEEKKNIEEMLKTSSAWFAKAASGSFHYSNKVMSDGALMLLIADITGCLKKEADEFWSEWHKYADSCGWGWGENSSDCYSNIMLNALNSAIISSDGTLKEKNIQKRNALMDYILYHDGKEFIPSIRTYNFNAEAGYGGVLHKLINNCDDALMSMVSPHAPAVLTAVLAKEAGVDVYTPNNSSIRKERLFKDSYAYTWKKSNIRLGSVSHFPVMPCSYQNQVAKPDGSVSTYGLGWQSMPVSAMLDDVVGFLRIRTIVGENEHSHPAISKHDGYLFNRLFEDGNTVVFSTISAQKNNIAIVTRYANKIANTASFICDEWCIDANISELKINDRIWYIASKGNCGVALLPLGEISTQSNTFAPLKTYISHSGSFNTVTCELYSGKNKMVFTPRLESSWVIVAIENVNDAKNILEKLNISIELVRNTEVSLLPEYKMRKIVVSSPEVDTELLIDPVNQYDF